MAFTKVARVSELPPGELIEVMHNGNPYAVCNVNGQIRALYGVCPHEGGPLGQGGLEGPVITCPWHCWEFDSGTGLCLVGDDIELETYEVRVESEDILVDLP